MEIFKRTSLPGATNVDPLKGNKAYLAFGLVLILITTAIPDAFAPYCTIAIVIFAMGQFTYLLVSWNEWWLKLSAGLIIAILLVMVVILINRL